MRYSQTAPAPPLQRAAEQLRSASPDRAGPDWLFVMAVFNVVLLSGAVQYFNIFALAGVNIALQILMLIKIRFRISAKMTVPALLIYVYLLYGFMVTQSSSDIIFIAFRFHDIFTAFLMINYILIRQVKLGEVLAIVLKILIVHGFLNWLIATFLFELFSKAPNIASHRWLIFFVKNDQYLGIFRNQGLFWEPGVYQIYLNVALHLFLFYAKSKFWTAAAFLGLLLTLSTTGLVLAAVQLAVFVAGQRQQIVIKAIKILIAAPFLAAFVFFTQGIVEDKLVGERSGSYLARNFDARTGINVALENPFGIGFNPDTYQEYARSNAFDIVVGLNTDRGQTNGLLILTYSTGFLWAIVILFLTLRQSIFQKTRWLFFLVLAGSLTSEPLFYSPFVWMFIVSGIAGAGPLIRDTK